MPIKFSPSDDVLQTLNLMRRAGYNNNCVIAGACLRDMYHDQLYEDVDIFFRVPANCAWGNSTASSKINEMPHHVDLDSTAWLDHWKTVFQLTPSKSIVSDSVLFSGETGVFQARGLASWTMLKDYTRYNLCVVDAESPMEYVEKSFFYALNKVWCDGVKMHYTSQFMRDVRNNTISFVRHCPVEFFNLAQDRLLPEIQAKYPGRQLVAYI